jgi:two-component system response regulator HydG
VTPFDSSLPFVGSRVLDDFDEVRMRLRERPLTRTAHLAVENRELRGALASPRAELAFVGTSPAARRLLQSIRAFGALSGPLLITGEAGVGKRLVAELVHRASARTGQPFVSVACAALPRELLDAEIFGERTDRNGFPVRLGRVELARGGTLFLDEVALLPLPLQMKVLALIKNTSHDDRLGGHVRIVASTSRGLRGLAQDRLFSRELSARLNAVAMRVPPLRERLSDIVAISEYLLARIAERRDTDGFGLTEDARKALLRYHWPGNVRELERALQRAVQTCTNGRIALDDLPPDVAEAAGVIVTRHALEGTPLREVERMALTQTLGACGGNAAEAARRLGISKKGMYIKMKRFGIAAAHGV